MSNQKRGLQIPYGTRDFLPHEAAQKRAIEVSIAELFRCWGYDEVVTPTIEYLDTLTTGNNGVLEPHMFKLFDKDNKTLALRHELTTPIARVVANRMQSEPMPLKLSYISNVFRFENSQNRQCEFYQAGVELIGNAKATADAEIIALAIACIKEAGIENFQLCLSQVDFINGMMDECGLMHNEQKAFKAAIEEHNMVALEELVDTTNISNSERMALKTIPMLHGDPSILTRAAKLCHNEQSRRAIDNLTEIYELLEAYGVAEYVRFDLSVIRAFNYYTGMVFEVYTPGLGYPLCGGGRYDNMLSDFGTSYPATGFAMGIESLMTALERQGRSHDVVKKDIFVAYGPGRKIEAIKQVISSRQNGRVVEMALSPLNESEAKLVMDARGYKELIYIR